MRPIEIRLTARVTEALRQRLAASSLDRENAPTLARELLALAPALRRVAVESDEIFASPGLGRLLLERAEPLLETDPREAAHLAGLTATIGSRLTAPWTLLEGESLQGRARSVEGEALRRRGRMADARKAHRLAFRHFETLPVGSAERASFCHCLARLRRDQGRDDEALALMARALERYASLADPRARECRLELAWMHLDDLENDEAAELLFAAWSGYVLRGQPYEAALALLELAQLRAEQCSAQDLERLKEGITVLAGLAENVREPLVFGLDFAKVHGLAAVEMLEALKLFVQRARHDPEARFVLDPEFGVLEEEVG